MPNYLRTYRLHTSFASQLNKLPHTLPFAHSHTSLLNDTNYLTPHSLQTPSLFFSTKPNYPWSYPLHSSSFPFFLNHTAFSTLLSPHLIAPNYTYPTIPPHISLPHTSHHMEIQPPPSHHTQTNAQHRNSSMQRRKTRASAHRHATQNFLHWTPRHSQARHTSITPRWPTCNTGWEQHWWALRQTTAELQGLESNGWSSREKTTKKKG